MSDGYQGRDVKTDTTYHIPLGAKLCQMDQFQRKLCPASLICQMPPKTNTIVFTIPSDLKRSSFHLSSTIITEVRLFGNAIYSVSGSKLLAETST